jgi:hypothetical protein
MFATLVTLVIYFHLVDVEEVLVVVDEVLANVRLAGSARKVGRLLEPI